MTRWRMCEFLL